MSPQSASRGAHQGSVCLRDPQVRTGPLFWAGEGRTVTWGLGEEPKHWQGRAAAGQEPMGGLHGRDSPTASWTNSTQGSEL